MHISERANHQQQTPSTPDRRAVGVVVSRWSYLCHSGSIFSVCCRLPPLASPSAQLQSIVPSLMTRYHLTYFTSSPTGREGESPANHSHTLFSGRYDATNDITVLPDYLYPDNLEHPPHGPAPCLLAPPLASWPRPPPLSPAPSWLWSGACRCEECETRIRTVCRSSRRGSRERRSEVNIFYQSNWILNKTCIFCGIVRQRGSAVRNASEVSMEITVYFSICRISNR